MNESVSAPIVHDPVAGRFSTRVEGHDCVLDYGVRDRVMTITHTGVPAPVGGRGIAAQLVTAALDCARREGWRVVPACSYVVVFLQRHHEYQPLLAADR